ncbi:hypothetical protein C8R48DRAFT_409679 [Suillus tomentosus]|nr:hypothetical protein C8R48DRAFT_409679 [Suillus tomentosus]
MFLQTTLKLFGRLLQTIALISPHLSEAEKILFRWSNRATCQTICSFSTPIIPRLRSLAILLPADRSVRIGRKPRVLFAHPNGNLYGGDPSRGHEGFVIISILVIDPRTSQSRCVCSTCAFLIEPTVKPCEAYRLCLGRLGIW